MVSALAISLGVHTLCFYCSEDGWPIVPSPLFTWWRHGVETLSASLVWTALKGPKMWSNDIFFGVSWNKLLLLTIELLVTWDTLTPMWHYCNYPKTYRRICVDICMVHKVFAGIGVNSPSKNDKYYNDSVLIDDVAVHILHQRLIVELLMIILDITMWLATLLPQ